MSDTGKKIRNRNVPEDKWNDSACKGLHARGTMRHTYLRVCFFQGMCSADTVISRQLEEPSSTNLVGVSE